MPKKRRKGPPPGLGMTPCKTELGSYIRARRLQLGLSQSELARMVGCKQNALSHIEIGARKKFADHEIDALANALRCDPEALRRLLPDKKLKKKKWQPPGFGMTPCKTELGCYIRAHRLQLGLSQVAVSQLSGMRKSAVSDLEVGLRKHLKDHQVIALAKTLQCDPKALRTRIPAKPHSTPTTELGTFIRVKREALGMSLEAFAGVLNIDPQRAHSLETGKQNRINYNLFQRLACALQIPPSDLSRFLPGSQRTSKTAIGSLIRERRLAIGIRLGNLARQLGVSRQYLGQIELGLYDLSRSDALIIRIADALTLDPQELMLARQKGTMKARQHSKEPRRPLASTRAPRRHTKREVA